MDSLFTALAADPAQAPLTDNAVLEDYGQSMVYRGRQAVISVLRAYFGLGFSNGRIEIHTAFSNPPARAVAFTFLGRQDGVFLGIPATGREVAVPMMLLYRLAKGHIYYLAWYYDAGTLLRQLGLSLSKNALWSTGA